MIALLSSLAIFARGALLAEACAPHRTSACLTKSWILILLFCPSCVCMHSSSGMKGGCAESVSCFGHLISPSTAKTIRSLSGFPGEVPACFYPRGQFLEIRAFGYRPEPPQSFCLLLVCRAPFSDPLLWAVSVAFTIELKTYM